MNNIMINTNIYKNNSISFGASPCGTTEILKRAKGKFKPFKVSIVKLNPSEEYDLRVIQKLGKEWDRMDGGYFAENISEMASKEKKLTLEAGMNSNKYYAMTTQDDKFKKLDPTKVLALAVVEERPRAKRDDLKWLQGNPEFIFLKGEKRLYTDIGKKLVIFIREFNNKKLQAIIAKNCTGFYEKLNAYRPFKNSPNFVHID